MESALPNDTAKEKNSESKIHSMKFGWKNIRCFKEYSTLHITLYAALQETL